MSFSTHQPCCVSSWLHSCLSWLAEFKWHWCLFTSTFSLPVHWCCLISLPPLLHHLHSFSGFSPLFEYVSCGGLAQCGAFSLSGTLSPGLRVLVLSIVLAGGSSSHQSNLLSKVSRVHTHTWVSENYALVCTQEVDHEEGGTICLRLKVWLLIYLLPTTIIFEHLKYNSCG